jgi:hypothetical protein
MKQQKNKTPRKPILSLFRRKIEDKNFDHDATLNRDLDSFGFKLIKIVGGAALIIGIGILVAFWVWVIRWLYQVW